VFNVSPVHSIPSDGKIIVEFPPWNINLGASAGEYLYYIRGGVLCKGISGTLKTDSSGVTCQVTGPTANVQTVTISNIFTGITTAPFSFEIDGVLNPPNDLPADGFVIKTGNGTDGLIDSTDADTKLKIEAQAYKPNTLTVSGVSFNPKTVGSTATYDVSFMT
jgi:hypothetical protein